MAKNFANRYKTIKTPEEVQINNIISYLKKENKKNHFIVENIYKNLAYTKDGQTIGHYSKPFLYQYLSAYYLMLLGREAEKDTPKPLIFLKQILDENENELQRIINGLGDWHKIRISKRSIYVSKFYIEKHLTNVDKQI